MDAQSELALKDLMIKPEICSLKQLFNRLHLEPLIQYSLICFQSRDLFKLTDYTLTFIGKVHGSLARAGKVKSQTPKVAKQEKKKKLTGRAKKRDTYKRRFVNVTNAPGGKRRMNVNPESSKN
ncbi:hypothetical protein FBU30_006314 [Linnemannia zychae]|nr:hypothetical protein FBU30_006314 [Linnemannia zychae]